MSPIPELGIPAVYTIIPGAHFLDRTRDTDFAQHAARTLLRGAPPDQIPPQMQRLLDQFGPRYDLTFFLAHSLELEGEAAGALELFREALSQQPGPAGNRQHSRPHWLLPQRSRRLLRSIG